MNNRRDFSRLFVFRIFMYSTNIDKEFFCHLIGDGEFNPSFMRAIDREYTEIIK